jgi:peptidoglycan-associated lipoprotein
MKKLLKVVMLSAAVVGLAACHSTKPANEVANTETNANAQAYALGQKGGLNGADVGNGGRAVRHVNTTEAPVNQVYYFAFDQSHVRADDMPAIRAQAKYLEANPNAKVRLEGNADDRGSREYNVALGMRRADAVEMALMANGVAKNQITKVSYGKEHPAVLGDNEHAWSLNRRVELVYVRK